MPEFRLPGLEAFEAGRSGDIVNLSMPLPSTAAGKVNRACPNAECRPGIFQIGRPPSVRPEVLASRRLREPGLPTTTCPYCATTDADQAFLCQNDVAALHEQIGWSAEQAVGEILSTAAAQFNRQKSGSLFSVKMSVQATARPRPFAYRQDLLRDLACDACGTRYGVYAVGLFCPDCAAPNLLTHFEREMELVAEQSALAEKARADGSIELAFRLLGNAHEDVLTSFETYLKTCHRHFARQKCVPLKAGKTNQFQNVGRARSAFDAVGLDPFEDLAVDQMALLKLNIEKRHVVGHNLGLVDDHFAEAAQDAKPGEAVELTSEDVLQFGALCRIAIARIDRALTV